MSYILRIYRIWHMSRMALTAYTVRGIFVILAVALGIASLTIIVSTIEGANKKAEEITSAFGSDALLIFAGTLKGGFSSTSDTITAQDIMFMKDNLSQIQYIVPMRVKAHVSLKYKNNSFTVATVTGATQEYTKAWRWAIVEGHEFSSSDVKRGENVVLIGETVKRELFQGIDPIGEQIIMNGVTRLTVVGVLDERSAGGLYDVNDTIVLPLQTFFLRFNMKRDRYDSVRIVFQDASQMDRYEKAVREMLRYRHELKEGKEDDFTIVSPKEVLRFMSFIKGGISVFLGVAALGALTVGGFVLANLFYISVAERTVEIGVKKAIGATRGDIILQFLLESIALTCIGSLFGMILGIGIGYILEWLDVIEVRFSTFVFISAIIAAVSLGVIFGLKPARRASMINPIVALKGGE